MQVLDIANIFISKYADHAPLSNLSLNKLVYFAQVESLRSTGRPLFTDKIEAWQYGPVEPSVYHVFKGYGSSHIFSTYGKVTADPDAIQIVDDTFAKYGKLTAYDLVDLAHRAGSAWSNVYQPDTEHKEITTSDILASEDGKQELDYEKTLASSLREVDRRWPNTFKLLRNA